MRLKESGFRVGVLASVAAFSTPVAAAPSDPTHLPPGWTDHQTLHYLIRSNATREHLKDFSEYMNLVFKTYTSLLVKTESPTVPLGRASIVLFANRLDYLKAGQPPQAGAYYRPTTKTLVGFYHPISTKPVFAHEGMHQFMDMTMPNFGQNVPMWFIEGIADCIGNSVERDGKLFMCSLSGYIAAMRLPLIARLIKEEKHVPLPRLLTMGRQEFMMNASICYAESWAFCHFLMTYPKREEPTRQIPNGKYRPMISAFYESLLEKRATAESAWAAAMKAGRVASIEAMETEWKAYLLDLAKPDPDSAYLGVQIDGKRVTDGVVIDTVAEDSPAEKAGLQPGDQIIKFDERPVEFWNDFLSRLRTKRPGDSIAITVKRDEKEVRLPVKLEKRGER